MDRENYNYDPMTGERITPLPEAGSSSSSDDSAERNAAEGNFTESNVAEGNFAERNSAEENSAESNVVESNFAEGNAAESMMESEAREQPIWSATNPPEPEERKRAKRREKKEKAKKPWGFLRKTVAAVALAAVFGGVAGGTFYGICRYTGLIDKYEQALNTQTEIMQGQTNVPIRQIEAKDEDTVRFTNSSNIQLVTTDVSDVVEEVIPAMVTILNTSRVKEYDFWGNSYTPQYGGSGIIIGENDEEILIVTNHHVAASSAKLEITFIDGTTAEAKVKGMDSDMDLAVLAVALSDLSDETKSSVAIAQLGDSDSLKLGQPAIVIGNALGIGISVTDGVISGLNREMTTEDGLTGTYIQTDAAVNHGNSGGALLNVKGEVVGIVSNKLTGSDVDNMGYAIPVNAATPIIAELMEHQTRREKVSEEEMGYLGVILQTFDDSARSYYNIPAGAFVYSVDKGSGAEKAGIYKGDVITKVEKESVTSASDVKAILQYFKQGDVVTVTVKRLEAGEYVTHDLKVTLGASSSVE